MAKIQLKSSKTRLKLYKRRIFISLKFFKSPIAKLEIFCISCLLSISLQEERHTEPTWLRFWCTALSTRLGFDLLTLLSFSTLNRNIFWFMFVYCIACFLLFLCFFLLYFQRCQQSIPFVCHSSSSFFSLESRSAQGTISPGIRRV